MASESEIKTAIESLISTYTSWTIGVTDDHSRQRKEHGYHAACYQWNANSEQSARNVESYFLAKGMKGSNGGGGGADYVHIFL